MYVKYTQHVYIYTVLYIYTYFSDICTCMHVYVCVCIRVYLGFNMGIEDTSMHMFPSRKKVNTK